MTRLKLSMLQRENRRKMFKFLLTSSHTPLYQVYLSRSSYSLDDFLLLRPGSATAIGLAAIPTAPTIKRAIIVEMNRMMNKIVKGDEWALGFAN